MGIKAKKICILWGFTEKSEFQYWLTNIYIYIYINIYICIYIYIYIYIFSKKGELGQFADLRSGFAKKGGGVEGY